MDGVFYVNDEAERIRRVQHWLRELSRNDGRISEVFIDGIYGDETRKAVADVQRISGSAVTGELDKDTFDTVFRLFTELSDTKVRPYLPRFDNYEGGKMSPGDVFDDIYLLQLLLRELSLKDERFFVEASGSFDEQTERAVRLLQTVLGIVEDGTVSIREWNALIALTENTEGYL